MFLALLRPCTKSRNQKKMISMHCNPVQCQIRDFPVKFSHTGKNLYSLQGTPFLITGISLWEKLHRENPVFITGKGFHQYSWNSAVVTTWISMIGWPQKTSITYLCPMCMCIIAATLIHGVSYMHRFWFFCWVTLRFSKDGY